MKQGDAKNKIRRVYLIGIKLTAKSKLYCDNLIKITKVWTENVLRYVQRYIVSEG